MNVELPNTGCNILISNDKLENYSADGAIRSTYIIQNAKLYLSSVEVGEFQPTGTCLSTGDIEWRPEYKIAAELVSIFLVAFIFWFIYHITLRRFIK